MSATVQKEQRITEDEWQRIATASAIAAVREVVAGMNGRIAIGSVSEVEWGWIIAAAIFGWIKTRAEQAVAEGTAPDLTIRSISARNPEPWEAGAIHTILPGLAELPNVDWGKPLGEWSKDQITAFAWQAYKLTDQALARRDAGASPNTLARFNKEKSERETSAANKGPLKSRKELKDEMNDFIPF